MLPCFTSVLHSLVAGMIAASLMGDINLVGDHNGARGGGIRCRCRIGLQALHLDVFHHPLLTLSKRHVDGDRIHTSGPATLATGIIAAADDAPETTRG